MLWYICEGGGRRNMGKTADGSKGGVHGDVSLELISWTLRPLGVGSRAGWQVPSARWVIQEGPLPLACLFITQPRSAHIFPQVLVISPSLPHVRQSYFPRKSEMKYHLLGHRSSLEMSVTSVGVVWVVVSPGQNMSLGQFVIWLGESLESRSSWADLLPMLVCSCLTKCYWQGWPEAPAGPFDLAGVEDQALFATYSHTVQNSWKNGCSFLLK